MWLLDDVRDIQSATAYAVPNPASGTDTQVIATNGTTYELVDIVQVPDPTGHSGEQLGTDGALIFWEAKTAQTVYTSTSLPGGITQGATSTQIGKMLT